MLLNNIMSSLKHPQVRYGQRKRKVADCANPIFVKILTDLKNEAEEKGWKSQYTYAKALHSLKKYPLSIPSGKGCKFLENFGDKICKILDDRLPLYASQAQSTETENDNTDGGSVSPTLPSSHVDGASSCSTSPPPTSQEDVTSRSSGTKRRRSVHPSSKHYIPPHRSGSYAIILALYNELKSAHSKGYLTKDEVIRSAQPLADKSFTVPDPGGRYTAWASMGSLIKKGLVIKESSPAKYSITAAGVDLAEKLDTAAQFSASNHHPESSTNQKPAHMPERAAGSDGMTFDVTSDNVASKLSPFMYVYISDSDEKTSHKDQAKVTINDEIGLGFLINCRYSDLLRSGKSYSVDITRALGEEYIFAYLKDDDADEIAPNPPVRSNTKVGPAEKIAITDHATSSNPIVATTTSNPDIAVDAISPGYEPRVNSIPAASDIRSRDPLFVLAPGSFRIVLCVDNREFYGASSSGGKQLVPGLMKNNVDCDLRKLEAGDFVWVAQEMNTAGSNSNQGRELVLDYIVERKRMDDLVSSCVDGRLKEQKFRMNHSGLRRPIYLIEEYGSAKNYSLSEDRLRQTLTNIQVIDKFQVKRTGDTKESVAYLTVMTRYLQSLFQNKTLLAYKSEDLQEHPRVYDVNRPKICLMTFADFNQSTVKTKPLTVEETFGKQLVQMYRMSVDSATAILSVYPTPSSLFSAYGACRTEKDRENLLSSLKIGKSGRNLGVVMSRQLYQFYCTKTALT